MPITLSQNQLIAAGRALEELGTDAKIESLRVDGQEVTSFADAREAYTAANAPLAESDPGFVDRVTDKVADKLDTFEDRLESSSWGRKLKKIITADPERVITKVLVQAKLSDGTSVELPVEVLDREATLLLQRASSFSELVGLLPLLGFVVPIITAAGNAVGAGVSKLLGKDALAKSMWKTAGKHSALFAAGLVPVVGSATSAAAAAIDHIDARNANRAPTVAEIVRPGEP